MVVCVLGLTVFQVDDTLAYMLWVPCPDWKSRFHGRKLKCLNSLNCVLRTSSRITERVGWRGVQSPPFVPRPYMFSFNWGSASAPALTLHPL